MTIHDRFESLADLCAAGALSADERREVEEHAASCAECATALREATDFAEWATRTVASDRSPSTVHERERSDTCHVECEVQP